MTELVLRSYINRGISLRGVSRAEAVSLSTVRHYAKKYGVTSSKKSFSQQDTAANECNSCGVKLTKENRYKCINHVKCKTCYNKYRHARSINNKKLMIEYMGGACKVCGYNKCYEALEFHHLDPSKKDFGLSKLRGRAFENTKSELNKCVLVCSNCHREAHAGLIEV